MRNSLRGRRQVGCRAEEEGSSGGAADAVPGGAHVRLDKEYPAEPVYDR